MRAAVAVVVSCFLASPLARAAPIPGTVVTGIVIAVPMGDRLVLRSDDDQRIDVRIAEITVPRSPQRLRLASQQSLSALCLGEVATLTATGTALDGSTVGKVSCGGIPVAEHQVRRGLARAKPRSARLDTLLRDAQNDAQTAGAGLWGPATAAPAS